jgi:hypothetical protein
LLHKKLIDSLIEDMLTNSGSFVNTELSDYHKGWILLQGLELISGLFEERKGIVEDIKELSNNKQITKILIAGAADFGLLSILHEVFEGDLLNKDVYIIDCHSGALYLSQVYADCFGLKITTIESNLIEFSDSQLANSIDLIISHSLWHVHLETISTLLNKFK